MAGKQGKISNTCPESCSLFSYSIANVLLYVFVRVFYENHGKDEVYSLVSLLKKIFN